MLGLLFFFSLAAVAGLTVAHGSERDRLSVLALQHRDVSGAPLDTDLEGVLLPRAQAISSPNLLTKRGNRSPPKGIPSASGKQSKSPSPEQVGQPTRNAASNSPTPQPKARLREAQPATSVKSSRAPSPAPPHRPRTRAYSSNLLEPGLVPWQSKKTRTGVKPSVKRNTGPAGSPQSEHGKGQLKRPRPDDTVANNSGAMLPPPPKKPAPGRPPSARLAALVQASTGTFSSGKQAPSDAASAAVLTGKNQQDSKYRWSAPEVPKAEELFPKEQTALGVNHAKATDSKKDGHYRWSAPAVPNAEGLFSREKPKARSS